MCSFDTHTGVFRRRWEDTSTNKEGRRAKLARSRSPSVCMLARASRVSRVSRASHVSRASIDAASERKSRVSAIFQRAVGRLREEQVAEEQLNATWDEERGHQIMQQRQRTGDEVLYRYRASRVSAAAAEPTPPPQPAAKAPSLLRTVTSFMLSSRNKAEAAHA